MSALATFDKVAARTPDGVTLFDNLSLTFGSERTGVVGRNGAGKSTLLRLIAGTQPPSEGAVVRNASIGVLAQRTEPQAGETVAGALGVAAGVAVIDRVLAGRGSADDLAEVIELLEEAGGAWPLGIEEIALAEAPEALPGMWPRLLGLLEAAGVRLVAVAAAREAGRKYITVASEVLGEAAA